MFLIVAAALGIAGVLGALFSYKIGGYIHILPVLAFAVLLFGLVRGALRARMVITIMLIVLGLAVFTNEGIRYMADGGDLESGAVKAATGRGVPAPLVLVAGGLALMVGLFLVPFETHRAFPSQRFDAPKRSPRGRRPYRTPSIDSYTAQERPALMGSAQVDGTKSAMAL